MLKLNLSSDPRWVDLAGSVRIKVRPLSSAMMLAARSEPSSMDNRLKGLSQRTVVRSKFSSRRIPVQNTLLSTSEYFGRVASCYP